MVEELRLANLNSSTNFYIEIGNRLVTIKSSVEKISKIKFYTHKPDHKHFFTNIYIF
jgi:hypothetical protein